MKELAVSAVGSAANAVGSAAVAPYFDRIMAHLKAYLALNADAAGDPETQVRPRCINIKIRYSHQRGVS